jgi:hypothetical protein
VLAAFYLTKSLLCNVAILSGMPFILESSEKCFKMFKEDYVQIPTQRSRIPSFRSDGPVMRSDAHQCLEDLNISRFHSSERHGNTLGCHSEFEKFSDFLCRHVYEKTAVSVWTSG